MGAERPPLLLLYGAKMDAQTFRRKQKELLGEIQRQTGAAVTWTDPTLDSWRDDEITTLYANGLYRVGSTRVLAGWTETTIPENTGGVLQRYFPMPTSMRTVTKVEFINTVTDEVHGGTTHFDSWETPGFVRIDIAHGFSGDKIRLFGEFEYLTIDECPAEVADVCKFGSVVRALVGEYIQRQRSARRRTSTRTTDVSPGAIAAGIAVLTQQYKEKKAAALSVQFVRAFRG